MIKIQIYTQNAWQTAAYITLKGSRIDGAAAETTFEYDPQYVDRNVNKVGSYAVSCHLPVTYEIKELPHSPAFLLDLFPQGMALKYVVEKLGIRDDKKNYWKILEEAPIAPPGNLRIQSTTFEKIVLDQHPGFERAEVLQKGTEFLKYMVDHGAPTSGSTGAAGAAPKFMLSEDQNGKFHAPNALSAAMTRKFWLVKFPRGEKTATDRNILRTEKLYYEIAKWFGLKTTTDPIEWDSDCLFVPRFDREVKGKNVAHYGLESFYSLANEINFGSRLEHETYIIAIKKFSTKKNEDALEYIFREFLNEMMGNTDNHGRNTSMFKQGDQVEIYPLYDFAPMQFDPEGIVRNTNWSKKSANGNIAGIGNFLASEKIVSFDTFKEALSKKLPKLKILDKKMREVGVPEKFIAGTLNDRNRRIKEIEDFCSNA